MMNLLALLKMAEATKQPSLLTGTVLPAGIDREVLEKKIIYDNWDLMPNITDYPLFKLMVDNFFATKLLSYTNILEALTKKYDPLHNYDRYEDKKENRKLSTTHNDTFNEDMEDESNTDVSAYDSSTYQPRDKITDKSKKKSVDSRQGVDDEDYTTENHLYGNIGVTTSQQMLQAEIDLRIKNDIYKIISIDFRDEFMLKLM